MNKRIISLLLAIVLTLGTLLSLSSCMAMINAIMDSGDSSGEKHPCVVKSQKLCYNTDSKREYYKLEKADVVYSGGCKYLTRCAC